MSMLVSASVAVAATVFALAVVAPASASATPPAEVLHAAPNGAGPACSVPRPCSLTEAQQRVRHVLATGEGRVKDIVVQLAGGTYRLTAPLRFGPQDSGRNGHTVTWTAAPGAHPVISGASRVSGWTQVGSTGVWSARVPGGSASRQLYVDGREAPVAQASPAQLDFEGGWKGSSYGYDISADSVAQRWFAKLTPEQAAGIEFDYPGGNGAWTESRCRVASAEVAADDTSNSTLTMDQPCWTDVTDRAKFRDASGGLPSMNPNTMPALIENAYALLHPGQWFLDSAADTLYYMPTAAQKMTDLDVELPRLQTLVQGAGTLAHPLHDVTFSGLQFSYATWNDPSTDVGFADVQSNLRMTGANNQGMCNFSTAAGTCPWGALTQPHANVAFTASDHVNLTGNRFVDLGGAGLSIMYGSSHDLIQGNEFTQIASTAILLGCTYDPTPTNPADASDIKAHCTPDPSAVADDTIGANEILSYTTVRDNVVHDIGTDYSSACGITLLFSQHTTITHNDLYDLPYTALTAGVIQGHVDDANHPENSTNINADNTISDNVFHDYMQKRADGGAIYIEGHQSQYIYQADGTTIDSAQTLAHGMQVTGNVAYNGHTNFTYYDDAGSEWINWHGNVAFNVGNAAQGGCSSTGHIWIIGNYVSAPTSQWACRHPVDTHDSGNISIPSDPGPADLPLNVLAGAGVQSARQAFEVASPATVDYSGVSPASAGAPAEVLVAGSGFTRSTLVYVGGVAAPHVRFLSPGMLVATVPAGVSATAKVTVRQVLTLTPASELLQPGQPAQLTATITDLFAGFPLIDATVSLSAAGAPGWQVAPATVALGTVTPGQTVSKQVAVTAPSTGSGTATIRAELHYTVDGITGFVDASSTVAVPYPNLAAGYDNVAVTADTDTDAGDIDGSGSSLSAQALAAVGVTPGSSITHDGMQFTWPDVLAGRRDNVLASGQAFDLSGTGTALGILATATYGPASGTGTITYTDGTTQRYTLTVPDWYSTPPRGSDAAITMNYRNRPGDAQDAHDVRVFLVQVPLQAGKTASVVTLPDVTASAIAGSPAMHVFAIALGTFVPRPAITEPADGSTGVAGTPAIAGTGAAGDAMTVSDSVSSGPVCTTVVSASGRWACTATELADGPHTLSATQSDPTGVRSSLPITITVDNPALVRVNDTDPSIKYGGWTYAGDRSASGILGDYQDDIHYTTSNGDTASLTFAGTGITVYGERNPDQGDVGVSIDGGTQQVVSTVPADGNRHTNQAIFSAQDLSSGQHTIVITKLSGQYAVLDGFEIADR